MPLSITSVPNNMDIIIFWFLEMKLDELDNENPNVYNKTEDREVTAEEEDDDITDDFDSREIFGKCEKLCNMRIIMFL